MTQDERKKLEILSDRLKKELETLLISAAMIDVLPSNSTLQRVAQLELNIGAIESTLHER